MSTAFAGFRLGLALILVIGAQNAIVLRQGIRREHVFVTCLFCSASDAVLILAGTSGFSLATEVWPWFVPALKWAGVTFLVWYGAHAFRSAMAGGESLVSGREAPTALGRTLGLLAAVTWLNPHVYLDTVVLLGAVSAQYPGEWLSFALGAMAASFAFFFTLGYGARLLAPVFARPRAWVVLDSGVGVLMWSLALGLSLR